VLSIETLLDVSTLMIEEVTGRLKAAEDDDVEPPVVEGKLLLTEEEWHERNKKKEADDGSRADPMADEAVEATAVVAVAEAEVVAMVEVRPVAAATMTVTSVASRVIGPLIAGASSLRRMNRLLQPKRRSRLSCSLRLSPSAQQMEWPMAVTMSRWEMRIWVVTPSPLV
jgi:hypothetical protein